MLYLLMYRSIYEKFFHINSLLENKKPTPKRGFCTSTGRACDVAIRYGLAALNSSAETLVEALYAATSGRLLLLTSVERVTVGAHIQREVLT